MAVRKWSSAGSHDMNLAANYSGAGAILNTDTLLFDNTSVVDATATAGLDVSGISIMSTYTGHFNDGALLMDTHVIRGNGGFHCNSGGAVTIKGFWSVLVSSNIEITNVLGAIDIKDSYWGILGNSIFTIDILFGDIYIMAPGHVSLARDINIGNIMIATGGTFTSGAFVVTADSVSGQAAAIIDMTACDLLQLRYNITLEAATVFLFNAATVIRFIGTVAIIDRVGQSMPELVFETTYVQINGGGTIRRLRFVNNGSQVQFTAGQTYTILYIDPIADGWNGKSVGGWNGFSGWVMGGTQRAKLVLPASYTLDYFWVTDMEILGYNTITIVNGESYGNNRGWILFVNITEIAPVKGRSGETIQIYGNGFVYNQRGGEVYVGSEKLTIVSWYDSYIEGVLPALLDSGTIELHIINSDLNVASETFIYIYTERIIQKKFLAMPNIPYTYSSVIDVSMRNWDVPDDVMLAEVR